MTPTEKKMEKEKREEAIAFAQWLKPDEIMVLTWSKKAKGLVWTSYEMAYLKFKRQTKKVKK